MHIVIPCKNLFAGKSRLAPCLDTESRRAFCERLLIQTLGLAATLVMPDLIRVVTADTEVLAIAARYGAVGLRESNNGLNAALDTARANLLTEDTRADAMLIMPIDLPFATSDALAGALACRGDVVIGPDDSGTGTNLLLLRLAALRCLHFCFGPGSYTAHLSAARACGLKVSTFDDRRIAFDIDGPAQYLAWHKWNTCERTNAARSGLNR